MKSTKEDLKELIKKLEAILNGVQDKRIARSISNREDAEWKLDNPDEVRKLIKELSSKAKLSQDETDQMVSEFNRLLEDLTDPPTVAKLEARFNKELAKLDLILLDLIIAEISDARDKINLASEKLKDSIKKVERLREVFLYFTVAFNIMSAVVSTVPDSLRSLFGIVDVIDEEE